MCIRDSYDSSIKISEALIQSKKNIDFLIADEAHRTAGVNSEYSICLDDKKFKAKKKLFMTATQRIIPVHIKSRLQEKEVDSLSMVDKDLYGVRFFFLMIRRPPRSTLSSSSAASDVYKRQVL